MRHDLLLRARRAMCPATGYDGPLGMAIRAGRIVALGPNEDGTATRTLDVPEGAVLLPGLIDLHAHPARSISVYGVDPDTHLLGRGTTTVLSQGDAGADNVAAYLRETIATSRMRVLLALSVSRIGESSRAGCCANPDNADVDAAIVAIEAHREHIWGLALNASHFACPTGDPREIVRRGLEIARATQVPILYGLRRPEDWPLADQLRQLRAGDVVTYCYRSRPHCIVEQGRVLPAVREARARGVLFDVGHGTNSFDFDVAAAALADGFPPDTISTDLQRDHLAGPRFDLPLVMSKLRAAGMAERDVFAAVTARPAAALRRSDLGRLAVGAAADFTVLACGPEETLYDCHGRGRVGPRWIPLLTFCAGAESSPIE